MSTETITDMDVDLVDGENRCMKCGQRAGVAMNANREGYFVHDRTGRTECEPCADTDCANPAVIRPYSWPLCAQHYTDAGGTQI